VLWSYSVKEFDKPFRILFARISSLVKKSGFTFTFKYLKEVLRILVRRLANVDVEKSTSIFVKTDKHGFPVIIPILLRDSILNKELPTHKRKKIIGALITCISIHRVFPTKVKPDLESILSSFNGLSQSLDNSLLIKSLKELNLFKKYTNNLRCSLYWSEAAGPNNVIAGFGSINDALALLHKPLVLYDIIKTLLLRGNIGLILYLLSIIILFGPIYILCVSLGITPSYKLGRLSVVYDQAGKARVIAITSYWVQLCLKPLHKFLFNKLRELSDVDGTFNQNYPFDRLLRRNSKIKPTLYGFDLSAATDRLPIVLQEDILKLIGFNLPWRTLLDIDWYLNFEGTAKVEPFMFDIRDIPKLDADSNKALALPFNRGNVPVDSIRYAVGQPMGALSSWAMLAITHHVIVIAASILAGKKDFKDYCVLGDDVVIANDEVAEQYLILMSSLGLSINRQKSVESKDFTEFAKKLKGFSGLDYSPIGAGLILQTIRSKSYSLRYIHELVSKGLISLVTLQEQLLLSPKFFGVNRKICAWSIALDSYIQSYLKGSTVDVGNPTMQSAPLVRYMNSNITRFYYPLLLQVAGEFVKARNKFKSEIFYFLRNILFINVTRKGLVSYPSVLNFLNLGFWILIIKHINTFLSLIQLRCKLYVWTTKPKRIPLHEIPILYDALDITSIASIKWGLKSKVQASTKVLADIIKNVDSGSLVHYYIYGKYPVRKR